MGAGEGSRGGKVVGHTTTGRPIYAGGGRLGGPKRPGPKFNSRPDAGGQLKPVRESIGSILAKVNAGKLGPVPATGRSEATAKAAMGHDPHPGVRQSTAHAPFNAGPNDPVHGGSGRSVLPGGGLGGSHSLSPTQKAASATIGAQAATQKAVAHNDYASNRDASDAHAQASDAHTAAAKAAQQMAGPNAKGAGKHEAMSLAHLHAAQAHALAGNKHPTARGGHVAAAEAFKNAGDFKSAGEHQKAAIAQGGPLPHEPARADGRGEKLRPRGNLDRPAVLNKPGYKPR